MIRRHLGAAALGLAAEEAGVHEQRRQRGSGRLGIARVVSGAEHADGDRLGRGGIAAFVLLAIDAPVAVRFARVAARGRDESAADLEAFRSALEAILVSPAFVFRFEVPPATVKPGHVGSSSYVFAVQEKPSS